MKNLNKKYGKTQRVFIEYIHKLYAAGKETVEIVDVVGYPSGAYVYPYRFFVEDMAYTTGHVTVVLNNLANAGILEKVSLGKLPLYKLNYNNQDIKDAGLFESRLRRDS